MYFEEAIDLDELHCPSCLEQTLELAGYCEESNLEVFELLHKVDALIKRVQTLEEVFEEPFVGIKDADIN